jgi:hypothetical protein
MQLRSQRLVLVCGIAAVFAYSLAGCNKAINLDELQLEPNQIAFQVQGMT